MLFQYEEGPRVCYDFGDELGNAVFVRVCPTCGRFVKADDVIANHEPNATCAKCGRVEMPFEGFF